MGKETQSRYFCRSDRNSRAAGCKPGVPRGFPGKSVGRGRQTRVEDLMNMERPLVSIVVLNYNYARFIPRSVGSVLRQTYEPIEVIVVHDASTDGSVEVIRAFGSRVAPVLKTTNGGHGAAFNSGFASCRGEIVMFLDADDYLYPDAARKV